MTLPAAYATMSMGDINVELGRSRTAQISINSAEDGGYGAINQNSASRPSSSDPAAISEWYSYNHNAAAPSSCFFLPEVARGTSSGVACNNANSGIYISVAANSDTLLGATLMYRRCSDLLPGLSAWYSDGARARNWNGSAFVGSPVQCII